eukprot:scaffold8005_cov118-Isochrysis_galbana.AAC.14
MARPASQRRGPQTLGTSRKTRCRRTFAARARNKARAQMPTVECTHAASPRPTPCRRSRISSLQQLCRRPRAPCVDPPAWTFASAFGTASHLTLSHRLCIPSHIENRRAAGGAVELWVPTPAGAEAWQTS